MKAATYAIEHFAHLLRGRHFYLYTDHKPLVDLSATHARTLNRLNEKQAEFDFELRYTPGGPLNPADYLSRQYATPTRVAALTQEAETYGAWNWRELQDQDEGIKQVRFALEGHGVWPPRFRRMAKQMALQNGIVGFLLPPRPGFPRDKRFRIVPPMDMQDKLLRDAHDDVLAGHTGEFGTSERLKTRFWWPGLANDVREHIRNCRVCDAAARSQDRPTAVTPLRIPTRPNERIHVDLWGPHKDDTGQKKWVCVLTDALTKIVQLHVMTDKSAHTTAEALLRWCTTYGIPEEVVTDQGKEFCNELVKDLWDRLKVDHHTTTPYHPRSNGQAERFNLKMLAFLQKMLIEYNLDSGAWPAFIPALTMQHNTAVHKATRSSPFQLMFGYSPNFALWPNLDDIVHARDVLTASDPATRQSLLQREVRANARDMLHLGQQQQLRQNDRARLAAAWRPAQKEAVWVRRQDLNTPNPSLALQWEPGVIVDCVRPDVYKVSRTTRKRKKVKTLNVQLLRPRAGATPEDDIGRESVDALLLRFTRDAVEHLYKASAHHRREGIAHTVRLLGDMWLGNNPTLGRGIPEGWSEDSTATASSEESDSYGTPGQSSPESPSPRYGLHTYPPWDEHHTHAFLDDLATRVQRILDGRKMRLAPWSSPRHKRPRREPEHSTHWDS